MQQNSLGDVARDARLLQVDLGRINVGSNWVCFLNFEKSRSQILKIFQSEDFPLLLRDLYVVLSLQVFTSNNTTIHILTKLFHNLIIKCLTRKFKLCPTQEEITWIAGEISGNSKNPGLRNKKKNIHQAEKKKDSRKLGADSPVPATPTPAPPGPVAPIPPPAGAGPRRMALAPRQQLGSK